MKPIISIVMPVYNVEKYIRQCLESIKHQTFSNFEVIIVDDGSPDNSDSIYKEYVNIDKRFKVIKKENGGVSKARNTGLEAASGDYVIFIDSDDWLPVDALETLYNKATESGADITIGDATIAYDTGVNEYVHLFNNEFCTENTDFIRDYKKAILGYVYNPLPYGGKCNMATGLGGPWNKLIRREILVKNNLRYDPYVLGIFDDCLFTLNLLNCVRIVSYVPKSVYFYRIIASSLIHKYRANALNVSDRIFERINEFISTQEEPEEFKRPYAFYIVRRFDETLGNYFFASGNKKLFWKRMKELKRTITNEPYMSAFEEVEINKLHKSRKAICQCARRRDAFGIWVVHSLKQIKLRMK